MKIRSKLFSIARFFITVLFVLVTNLAAIIVGAIPAFLILFILSFCCCFITNEVLESSFVLKLAVISAAASAVYLLLHYLIKDFGTMKRWSKKKMRKKWEEKIKKPMEDLFE